MEIIKLPAEHYLDLFIQNKPFALSRFGDGEALCIFHNEMKANCDGSRFLPSLEKPMREIFINQYDYYHCLLQCSFDYNGDKFKAFLEETCPDMPFYDGEIWQELSFSGRITELIESVSLYGNPIFVGGSHIKNIHKMKGFKYPPYHLQVSDRDSFLSIDIILQEIADLITQGHRMFLFSAGYTTKILIDNLYPYVKDECFLVDMGSVFDPYCGRLSRSRMRIEGYKYFKPFIK